MDVKLFQQYAGKLPASELMPVLFFGHGSPMNAIEDNIFTKGWRESVRDLPKPSVILCISAHWETRGTFVTAMEKPRTIHDFGGFPPELYNVNYPAHGSPELAIEAHNAVTRTNIGLDEHWGLDHGCWSVLIKAYPDADIPVVQLSLDYTQPPQYHFDLAKEIAALRRKGVLIVGSGNIVHNLRMLDWQNQTGGFDWAIEANAKFIELIQQSDYASLINYDRLGKACQLSVPTPEHYLPFLYTMALKDEHEKVTFFNDQLVMGSISMLSLKIDNATVNGRGYL
ncbi:MAG: 4,5-DOPA dioxygenase extradiol [Chitinophagales bacterium]